jgi:SLOG cluster3 family
MTVNVFLSASVPLPSRHPRFHETADVMAIKEAIKALVIEVIPRGRIIFGGHPAITPLVASLMASHFPNHTDRAVLYQSLEFDGQFPPEVEAFPKVVYTPKSLNGAAGSLLTMRKRMMSDYQIAVAVFIGGMEGVLDEFILARDLCPNAKFIPLASTGAAALEIFEKGQFADELKNDIGYATVFRRNMFSSE